MRLPKDDGIAPDNWLLPSSSRCKLVRLPKDDGSSPDSPFSSSSSVVTRPSLSVVTPNHSSSGLSLSQLVLSFQLSPSVASYSATNTARSGFIGGSGVLESVSVMATSSPIKPAILPINTMVSSPSSKLSAAGSTYNVACTASWPAGIAISGLNSAV